MKNMKIPPEAIEKAQTAANAKELAAFAEEYGMELTEEQAQECFDRLHPPAGEISDEELDNVAGGGCGKEDSKRIACTRCGSEDVQFQRSAGQGCDFRCQNCGEMFKVYL